MAKRQQRVHMRKRFILIDREHSNVLGDTAFDWNGQPVPPIPSISPVRAAAMLQSRGAPHHYPYRGLTVRRSHPNTVFDVYRPPPGFPRAPEGSLPDAVTRACEYVGSLKRVYPRCWICKLRMTLSASLASIARGSTATRSTGTGDKRCCSRCYVTRVLPARLKAEGAS